MRNQNKALYNVAYQQIIKKSFRQCDVIPFQWRLETSYTKQISAELQITTFILSSFKLRVKRDCDLELTLMWNKMVKLD